MALNPPQVLTCLHMCECTAHMCTIHAWAPRMWYCDGSALCSSLVSLTITDATIYVVLCPVRRIT